MFDLAKEEAYRAEVVFLSHLAPWYPGAQAQDISPNQGIKEHSPPLRQYPVIGHWLLSWGSLGNKILLTGLDLTVVEASVVVVVVVLSWMVTLVLF